jgi:hypothetical protein
MKEIDNISKQMHHQNAMYNANVTYQQNQRNLQYTYAMQMLQRNVHNVNSNHNNYNNLYYQSNKSVQNVDSNHNYNNLCYKSNHLTPYEYYNYAYNTNLNYNTYGNHINTNPCYSSNPATNGNSVAPCSIAYNKSNSFFDYFKNNLHPKEFIPNSNRNPPTVLPAPPQNQIEETAKEKPSSEQNIDLPSNVAKIDTEEDDDSGFTDINVYETIHESTKILTKQLTASYTETTFKYNFNLILIKHNAGKLGVKLTEENLSNSSIFIHWLQVAKLFEIDPHAFKRMFLNETKYPLSRNVAKFKMNEANKVLFDFIEKKLEIKLEDYGDVEETTLFVKNYLSDICDFVYNKNNSEQLKELIEKILKK